MVGGCCFTRWCPFSSLHNESCRRTRFRLPVLQPSRYTPPSRRPAGNDARQREPPIYRASSGFLTERDQIIPDDSTRHVKCFPPSNHVIVHAGKPTFLKSRDLADSFNHLNSLQVRLKTNPPILLVSYDSRRACPFEKHFANVLQAEKKIAPMCFMKLVLSILLALHMRGVEWSHSQ